MARLFHFGVKIPMVDKPNQVLFWFFLAATLLWVGTKVFYPTRSGST